LVGDGKVLRGRDGWLFLDGDRNWVLAQQAGELLLEAQQLEDWTTLLERRKRLLAARGIAYVFMVAPEAHSVYPDKLPEGAKHVELRPVTQLRDHLARLQSSVRLIYPLGELRDARQARDVYSATDSHWSDAGAYVAYKRLADEIEGLVPMRRLGDDEVVFVSRRMIGDLGYKEGRVSENLLGAELPARSAKLVHDNQIQNSGSLIRTECGDAPGSCVLMADSCGWALLKYLAESFGHLTYVHTSTLDMEFLKRESPDVVVNLVTERFLVTVPDDAQGLAVAARETRKMASGATRERVPYWELPVVPSITAVPSRQVVDRMYTDLLAEGRQQDATMILVLAYAGLLQGELCRLRWCDVHEHHLSVQGRDVQLMPTLASGLKRWRRSFETPPRPNALVLPGPHGGRWRRGEWAKWCTSVYEPLASRSGTRDTRTYLLRHFFAALLIEEGADAERLAAQLGVSIDEVNAVYGPWLLGRL
jgi:integrase